MPGTNVISISVLSHPKSDFGKRIFLGLTEKLYNSEEVNLEMDFKVPIFNIPYLLEERRLPHFNPILWKTYDFNIILIVLDHNLTGDESILEFLKFLIEFKNENENSFIQIVSDVIDIGNSDHVKLFGDQNILRPLAFIEDNALEIPETIESILSIFFIEFYHSLIKIMINKNTTNPVAKVILFLSHTKYGGKRITSSIKSFINGVTQLDEFFDVQDIQIGENFKLEIKRWLEKTETLFLTILTDNYSTRPICKMEVLLAKEYQKPILTINAIEKFEKRSFPYLNNTPVIKWENTPEKILLIIEIALREFLRVTVIKKEMHNFVNESGINVHEYICYPPELLTLSHLNLIGADCDPKIVIYPSPFIDEQEKKILQSLSPNVTFITPWQIS
jgi:hypothetical protein